MSVSFIIVGTINYVFFLTSHKKSVIRKEKETSYIKREQNGKYTCT